MDKIKVTIRNKIILMVLSWIQTDLNTEQNGLISRYNDLNNNIVLSKDENDLFSTKLNKNTYKQLVINECINDYNN